MRYPRTLCPTVVLMLAAGCHPGDGSPAQIAQRAGSSAPRTSSALPTRTVGQSQSDSSGVTISLHDGRHVVLRNNFSEGDDYVRYEYNGLITPRTYHLVKAMHYEGWTYALINPHSGHQTVVAERPLVSPDGNRVLVASMDFEVGYAPTILQVWRVGVDSLVLELGLQTGDYGSMSGWGASDARWLSATEVEFTKNWPSDDGQIARSARARLVFKRSGWALATPDV
jgi:hypothetical protein